MRPHRVALIATLICAGSIGAPAADQPAADTSRPATLAETVIAGASVPSEPWAAWDAGDAGIRTASGTEAVRTAPAHASRYSRKSYLFQTGTILVVAFKESQGGMLYPITDETALYMLRGSGTVGLGGEAVAQIGEGDVVAYPSGVLRGERDATVVLWKVVGTKPLAEVTPKVVRASEAGIRQLAYWPGQDGKRVVVTTPEAFAAAPPGAIKLEIKNYDFDGNAVGVTKNYKGGPTNKTTGQRDGLLYITSGKMRFFQDDVDVVVGPGDAVREAAGRYHNWIRLEDSSFVGIGTAPLATVTVENPNDYAGTARPSK